MKTIALTDMFRGYLVTDEAVSLGGLVANRGYSQPTKTDPTARQILYSDNGAEFKVGIGRDPETYKILVHLRPNNAAVAATLEDYEAIFNLVQLHMELEGITVQC